VSTAKPFSLNYDTQQDAYNEDVNGDGNLEPYMMVLSHVLVTKDASLDW
jgi:hypothetical protein